MKAVLVIFLLIIGNSTIAQIDIIDSCETHEDFCGSSFRIYSDSTFLDRFGCERHQGIRIGHYHTELDTTYLNIEPFTFDNFIDSIVFIEDTLNVEEIDILYYSRDGKSIHSEYNVLAQLDSARVWSDMGGPMFIRKRHSCVQNFNRGFDNFEKGIEYDPTARYNNSQTFLIKAECDLGLILRDLSIWIGVYRVVEVPRNTREVIIYYSFGSDILHEMSMYDVRLKEKGTSDIMECKGRIYKFE